MYKIPCRHTLIWGILLLWLSNLTAAQENPPAPPEGGANENQTREVGPVLQTPNPRYQIAIGDSFEISFRFTPEFNQTATVQPDGYINLRELPDMHVLGKTTPELAAMVQKAYSKILHDPVITIQLRDYEKPYFIAGGELGRPGKFELRGDTTVLQGIEIAGGFRDSAKHSQVLLFRRLSDQWTQVKEINAKQMLKTGDLTEDIHLRPGDYIFVPKNKWSKVKSLIPSSSVGLATPF
jgi:polysaccharide biosynthesis/export protein